MTITVTEKKKPLGKGLSALLGPDPENDPGDRIKTVPTASITLSKYQPRTFFSEKELNDLATSIKEVGILQPLIVRQVSQNEYELIAGERRLRAAHLAGLSEVPVILKNFDDRMSFEAALIENIQRSDLSPIEEAVAYQKFLDEYGYIQEELSSIIGKSRSHIANTLRLNSLPEKVRQFVHEGRITAGHARALLSTKGDIEYLADKIISEQLNVRQVEALTRKKKKKPVKQDEHFDQDIVALEEQMSKVIGAPVQIKIQGHKGAMEIHFTSLEDLDALVAKLSNLEELTTSARENSI